MEGAKKFILDAPLCSIRKKKKKKSKQINLSLTPVKRKLFIREKGEKKRHELGVVEGWKFVALKNNKKKQRLSREGSCVNHKCPCECICFNILEGTCYFITHPFLICQNYIGYYHRFSDGKNLCTFCFNNEISKPSLLEKSVLLKTNEGASTNNKELYSKSSWKIFDAGRFCCCMNPTCRDIYHNSSDHRDKLDYLYTYTPYLHHAFCGGCMRNSCYYTVSQNKSSTTSLKACNGCSVGSSS